MTPCSLIYRSSRLPQGSAGAAPHTCRAAQHGQASDLRGCYKRLLPAEPAAQTRRARRGEPSPSARPAGRGRHRPGGKGHSPGRQRASERALPRGLGTPPTGAGHPTGAGRPNRAGTPPRREGRPRRCRCHSARPAFPLPAGSDARGSGAQRPARFPQRRRRGPSAAAAPEPCCAAWAAGWGWSGRARSSCCPPAREAAPRSRSCRRRRQGRPSRSRASCRGTRKRCLARPKDSAVSVPGLPSFKYELRKPGCKCAFRLSPLSLLLKEEHFLNICCVDTMGGGLCVARIDLSV